ncbi:MAG: sigma-70 family RNA polymerase sigma factor [Glutamicibacter sp.]|uniref:sigma-70 family RNA polymerase sigma factor n=1 Tax=Glutamicibacter sp. TaxID=1931995 RepID=UPI002FCAE0E7
MEEPRESAALGQWNLQRRRLTVLAYNMLGAWAQAEDVVSEVGENLLKLDPAAAQQVRNWPAYLTTLTTRRAIDVLRSAQHQRTEYAGSWLPEPVDQQELPEDAAVTASMLRLGVLFLLEELSAPSRAANVLHHALGYTSVRIAEVLEISPAAARQLLSRASRKLGQARAPSRESGQLSALLSKIVEAIRAADAGELVSLLAEDAVLYSDGGGKVRAALNPVIGAHRIARFLMGVERKNPGRTVFMGRVNGEPALLFRLADRQDVVAIEVAEGSIRTILQVSNPDKLWQVGSRWDPLTG